MLVLTRKEGQVIHVGSDIRITILRIGGGSVVRVGIEAPPEIKILRGELRDEEDKEAA